MYNFIYKTGKIFVNAYTSLKDYLHFCFIIIAKFLSFHILNPAVFLVTLRQVYFTGVQINIGLLFLLPSSSDLLSWDFWENFFLV